jgi:hypothetical protein
MFQIMKFRVMSAQALVAGGKVKASGRIPLPEEIIKSAGLIFPRDVQVFLAKGFSR